MRLRAGERWVGVVSGEQWVGVVSGNRGGVTKVINVGEVGFAISAGGRAARRRVSESGRGC